MLPTLPRLSVAVAVSAHFLLFSERGGEPCALAASLPASEVAPSSRDQVSCRAEELAGRRMMGGEVSVSAFVNPAVIHELMWFAGSASGVGPTATAAAHRAGNAPGRAAERRAS
jgi:hypothetical protein